MCISPREAWCSEIHSLRESPLGFLPTTFHMAAANCWQYQWIWLDPEHVCTRGRQLCSKFVSWNFLSQVQSQAGLWTERVCSRLSILTFSSLIYLKLIMKTSIFKVGNFHYRPAVLNTYDHVINENAPRLNKRHGSRAGEEDTQTTEDNFRGFNRCLLRMTGL